MDYELHIKGFKTKEQVEEFISWYEGQGEQEASVWFEISDNIDVDFMGVDVNKEYTWRENALEAHLDL